MLNPENLEINLFLYNALKIKAWVNGPSAVMHLSERLAQTMSGSELPRFWSEKNKDLSASHPCVLLLKLCVMRREKAIHPYPYKWIPKWLEFWQTSREDAVSFFVTVTVLLLSWSFRNPELSRSTSPCCNYF